MKHLTLHFASLMLAAAAAGAYPLPAPVRAVAQDAGLFTLFAKPVLADIEARLAAGPLNPEVERPLLGARVHLALLLADDAGARATAERIRALQDNPEARAYAGATTFALIGARRADRGVDAPRFAAEFIRLLAALPGTAAMRAELERQRARIHSITPTALDTELAALADELHGATSCDFTQADRLIRLRHRRLDLLPLREEMLRVLDAAVSARRDAPGA